VIVRLGRWIGVLASVPVLLAFSAAFANAQTPDRCVGVMCRVGAPRQSVFAPFAPRLAASPSVAPRPALTDWTTWGFDVARSGYNPNETVLNPTTATQLRQTWTFDAGAIIDTQPTVASNVTITARGVPTTANLVFVGSEHGDFFAVNAANGIPVWRRQGRSGPHRTLGDRVTGCDDLPGRTFGVTSAPVLDRASNTVYVAAGDGKLYALDMSTGLTRSGWPVTITSDPVHEHVWGALTLASGDVYVPIASDCDIRPYHGRLVKVRVKTHRILASWSPIPRSHSGGGIWGWGGVSVERGTGRIFAATGNVFDSPTEHDYYAEHVVALSLNLRVLASNFAAQIGGDDDLSSTPMLYQAPGCPAQLAVMQKHGVLYVYNRTSLASGPVQTLQIGGSQSFIGGLAYDPHTRVVYVAHGYDASRGRSRHGLVALKVGRSCKLSLAWQQPSPNEGITSAATVANGVVYYGNGAGNRLFAYNAATGKPLWNSGTTVRGPVFAAPTIVNGALYAGSWDHKLHAFSIP
jgi:outer membrane protein assembly factor BamB